MDITRGHYFGKSADGKTRCSNCGDPWPEGPDELPARHCPNNPHDKK